MQRQRCRLKYSSALSILLNGVSKYSKKRKSLSTSKIYSRASSVRRNFRPACCNIGKNNRESARQCSNIILVTETYVYTRPRYLNRRIDAPSAHNPNKHSVPTTVPFFHHLHQTKTSFIPTPFLIYIHTQTPQLGQKGNDSAKRIENEKEPRKKDKSTNANNYVYNV